VPSVVHHPSNAIVELMRMPREAHDEVWLKEALQQAVRLELATLPPYLCGLWSIQEADQGSEVFETIHEIVFDEMSHMGLVCNMVTTVGEEPRIADSALVPTYPGPLPGGVQPDLTVSLTGLSKEALDMYAQIERPDDPVVEEFTTAPSIGAFYEEILQAFRARPDLITGARQITKLMAGAHGQGNNITPLATLTDVEAALKVIKEQGEGTTASPENPFPGEPGELAHFYSFLEMFHGRRLIRVSESPPAFDFLGDEIPMPQTLPMGTVPAGGWVAGGTPVSDAVQADLTSFNRHYSEMLRFLEKAWRAEPPGTATQMLNRAVGEMFSLQGTAQTLMATPLPDGSGKNYGPEFRYDEAEP
jgi:hypothetical protein